MPEAMRGVVKLFPLTQGIQLMKASFLGSPAQGGLLPIFVMLGGNGRMCLRGYQTLALRLAHNRQCGIGNAKPDRSKAEGK